MYSKRVSALDDMDREWLKQSVMHVLPDQHVG